jgi:hypothetical protein
MKSFSAEPELGQVSADAAASAAKKQAGNQAFAQGLHK